MVGASAEVGLGWIWGEAYTLVIGMTPHAEAASISDETAAGTARLGREMSAGLNEGAELEAALSPKPFADDSRRLGDLLGRSVRWSEAESSATGAFCGRGLAVAAVAGGVAAVAGCRVEEGDEEEGPAVAVLRRDCAWGFSAKAKSFLGGPGEVFEGFLGGSCLAKSALELGLSRAVIMPGPLDPEGFPFTSDACFFIGDLPLAAASAAGAGRFADSPSGLLRSPAGTQRCQPLRVNIEQHLNDADSLQALLVSLTHHRQLQNSKYARGVK